MAVKKKTSLLRWRHALVLPLLMGGAAYAQPQAAELPLSGWSLTLAEQAFAAYQRGNFSEAHSMATEVMRMRPDVQRIRRLVAATQGKNNVPVVVAKSTVQPGLVTSTFSMSVETAPSVDRVRGGAVKSESAERTEPEVRNLKPSAMHRNPKIQTNTVRTVDDKALLAQALTASPTSQTSSPASEGAAMATAQNIYDQITAGDAKGAVNAAEQALRKYPNDKKLREAHINALFAVGRAEEADQAVSQAIEKFGTDDSLLVLRENIRRQLADTSTYKLYRALERNEVEVALQNARQTVAYAPDVMGNRLLLAQLLMNAGKYDEAEKVTTAAIAIDRGDVLPLMQRGYARQFLGRRASSIADFDEVLTHKDLTVAEQKHYRVIMADAALAAGDSQAALDVLLPLGDKPADAADTMVMWRRRAAMAQINADSRAGAAEAAVLRPLALECRASPYGRECDLLPAAPAGDPAYVLAAATYKALADKDNRLALADARQAVRLDPENMDYQVMLLNTLVLNGQLEEADGVATEVIRRGKPSAQLLVQRGDIRAKLGQKVNADNDFSAALKLGTLPLAQKLALQIRLNRKADARATLDEAAKKGENLASSDRDLAYLAISVGDDAKALDAFARSDTVQKLGVNPLQDAAFTAIRAERDPQALAYLTRAADLIYTTPLELRSSSELTSLLNIRRNIAQVSREWGANASLSYRGTASSLGLGGATSANSNDSLQLGAEVYWRPFGYRNGKLFEVYARAFETPYSKAGGLTGASSIQGSVGLRWKPFATENFVLALGRLFPVGSKMASDTLAQVAYFNGSGGELRTDSPSWWTQQYYAEAGRYFQHPQTYGAANARIGRSFRLDTISSDLVAFPHAVLAADYSNAYVQRSAVGMGPGINFRYWYREDTYSSHRSYVDFTLQYRAKLSGDEQRSKGTFLTLLTSY